MMPMAAPDDPVLRRRRLRGRNIALLVALLGFCVVMYAVTIVRMSGG